MSLVRRPVDQQAPPPAEPSSMSEVEVEVSPLPPRRL